MRWFILAALLAPALVAAESANEAFTRLQTELDALEIAGMRCDLGIGAADPAGERKKTALDVLKACRPFFAARSKLQKSDSAIKFKKYAQQIANSPGGIEKINAVSGQLQRVAAVMERFENWRKKLFK